MKVFKVLVLAGLTGLYSAGAFAFEQTQLGTAHSGTALTGNSLAAGSSGAVAPSGVSGIGLADPQAGAKSSNSKPATGMQLRLPGFGVIGTMPKMDFGLELLYGTERDKLVEDDQSAIDNNLTIHGSVKHRF